MFSKIDLRKLKKKTTHTPILKTCTTSTQIIANIFLIFLLKEELIDSFGHVKQPPG